MSFTLTTNYSFKKPGVGTETDAWGDDINDNFDGIDAQIKNRQNEAAAAQTAANTANTAVAGKANTVHTHAQADVTNLVTDLAALAPIASPTFTGDPKAPTPSPGDNDTSLATTAFVTAAVAAAIGGGGGGYAPIASPTFTGDPKAPTPTAGDNDTSIATTAFVTAAVASGIAATSVDIKTSNYTLILTDAAKLIGMNVAGANTWTVPPNSSVPFPTGTVIDGGQYGAGQTTITPGSGVTLRASGGKLKSTAQYSGWTIKKIATNEWWVFGDLSA